MGSSKSKLTASSSSTTTTTSSVPDDPSGRRIAIAQEVLSTERSYVGSLDLCLQVWHAPIQDSLKTKKPILKQADLHHIFSNLTEIVQVQQAFLQDLEATIQEPAPRIGAMFMQHAENFKCYSTYINNYYVAINTLVKCQSKSKPFMEFNAEAIQRPEVQGLSLPSYLIMPVQRLPRYVLLLEDLSKNTPKKHPDHLPCLQALDLLREVADYVNEEKRIVENMQEVMQIQSSISGQPNLVSRERYFVQEGDFQVIDKKRDVAKSMHYMLFNDLLILMQENNALLSSLNLFSLNTNKKSWKALDTCHLLNVEVTDCKDKHDLANYMELKAEKKWVFQFASADEKGQWLDKYYATRARAPAKKK